jgi:hypothetical protein
MELRMCLRQKITMPSDEFKVEFLSGELCFMTSALTQNRLSCCPKGDVSFSTHWEDWEKWRFIEAGGGHVCISNLWHEGNVYSDKKRKILGSDNLRGDWEKWDVECVPYGYDCVIIKSVSHGTYFQVTSENKIEECNQFAWQLDPGHFSRFNISSKSHIQGLEAARLGLSSVRKTGSLGKTGKSTFLRMCWSLYSQQIIKDISRLTIKIQYTLLSQSFSENELWQLIPEEGQFGSVILQSKTHQRIILCLDHNEGRILTIPKTYDNPVSTQLILEPCYHNL